MNKMITVGLLLLSVVGLNAQDLSRFNVIKAGKNDAQKIISAYLLPVEKGLAYDGALHDYGVFHPRSTRKFSFGIGFDVAASAAHPADRTYDVQNLQLEMLEAVNPNQTIAQTYSGSITSIELQTKQKYRVPSTSAPFYQEKPLLTLDTPMGEDKPAVPFPVLFGYVQAGKSLASLNYLPFMKIKKGTVGVEQVGLGFKRIVFGEERGKMYVMLATGLQWNTVTYFLQIKPDEANLTFSYPDEQGPYDDQRLVVKTQSIPIRLNVVQKVGKVRVLAGGGYGVMKSDTRLIGRYPIYATDPANLFQVVVSDIVDPIQYERSINRAFADLGVLYHHKRFYGALRYAYSQYQNVDFSVGFML